MAKLKLIALSPIRHNGEDFEEGEDFEVEESQAKGLLASKSAMKAGGKKAKADAKPDGEGEGEGDNGGNGTGE